VTGLTESLTVPRHGVDADADAYADFRKAGVIVFDQLWPAARIAELLATLETLHPDYVGKVARRPDDRFEVGDGRFISPLTFAPPFDCADILLHPTLVRFFSRALGPKFVFEAIGVISALPGAAAQTLHSDGAWLFGEVGLDRILPAFAMTVVIPLVAMDAVSGMTALWPGSHLHDRDVDTDPYEAPEIATGSCAAWDFRLRHRGLANNGTQARPLLYVTVCRPFWIDHKNFEPGVNAKLLASRSAVAKLPEADRKRFMRARFVD